MRSPAPSRAQARQQSETACGDGGERRISPRKGEDKFILIDLVKWTSSLVEGDNATLNANVAVDLFSVSNRRQNLLHTFKMASSVKKDEWVDAIRAAMEQWKQHVLKNEEHEKVWKSMHYSCCTKRTHRA